MKITNCSRHNFSVFILAALLAGSGAQIVSGQVVQVFSSSTNTTSTTGGNGWGAGGKPKPTPTPGPPVDAQQVWRNTAGNTDFNASASWNGGAGPAPTTGDVAAFSGIAVAQPNLTSNTSIAGLYFTGTGTNGYTLTRTATPTFTLTGYATSIGIETGDATAVAIGAENTSGTNTISIPVILAPASGSTSTIFQAGGGTFVISGVISGSSINLTKTGAGTLTLSNNNTFSGGVTIKAGTVSATTNANALGSGTVTLGDTSGSASATLLGDTRTFANLITVASGSSGTLTIGNSGNNSAVFSGAVTLNNNLTLTASGTGSVKLSGGVTGTGDIVLNNTGTVNSTFLDTTLVNNTGTITNSGTGAGTATINSKLGANVTQVIQNSSTSVLSLTMTTNTAFVGSVAVNAGTVTLGSASALSSSNEVSVAAGATFDINAQNQTIAGLNGGTGTVTNSGGAKILTLGGSGTYSFGGTITATNTNNMAIVKSGAGTQILSGTNNYTGATTVSAGVLELASANALPGGIGSTGGSGPLVLNGGVIGLANGDFSRPLGSTATNGAVNLTGGGGFAAYGADRIVNLGGASAAVTWNTNNFVGNGNTFLLGASSADHTVDFQNPISLGPSGTNTRTIQVDNGSAAIDAKLSGVISGISTNKLLKTGTGTLALTANNTYMGATQIDAGTLYINGDQTSATGAVTVNNAGTVLGGTGIVGGSVTVGGSNAAAILEGGTGSTGQTLTLKGAVTMSTGSVIELALGASHTHSTIAISSTTLAFATSQDFKFIDLGATTGTYTGLITGVPNPGTSTLNSWVIDNSGYFGSFSWDSANGGEIDLNLTAVPEPGTWVAGALALLAVSYTQRRRLTRLLKRA